jgi:hypothetical protein
VESRIKLSIKRLFAVLVLIAGASTASAQTYWGYGGYGPKARGNYGPPYGPGPQYSSGGGDQFGYGPEAPNLYYGYHRPH